MLLGAQGKRKSKDKVDREKSSKEGGGAGILQTLLTHSQAEIQGLDVLLRNTAAVKDGNALFLGAVQKEISEIRSRQEEVDQRVQHELAAMMNVLLGSNAATQQLAATQAALLNRLAGGPGAGVSMQPPAVQVEDVTESHGNGPAPPI